MAYVITCGDEGIQVNQGTRFGFVGAGIKLDGFSKAVAILKKLFGDSIAVASSAENDWVKDKLELGNWEQTNATMQQQLAALAETEGLVYAGHLPFSDPKLLQHEIKGHMVRPQHVHIANKIMFTLGGGEQTYNLGNYLVSAEWVGSAPAKLVKQVIGAQVEHYQKLAGDVKLKFVFETRGILTEKQTKKNLAALKTAGVSGE